MVQSHADEWGVSLAAAIRRMIREYKESKRDAKR